MINMTIQQFQNEVERLLGRALTAQEYAKMYGFYMRKASAHETFCEIIAPLYQRERLAGDGEYL